jgi:predicted SAM-dependent methyltransferase
MGVRQKMYMMNKLVKNIILKILRIKYWLLIRIELGIIHYLLEEKAPIINAEIGSGPKKGKGNWMTVDRCYGCDVICDLKKGLPYPKECLSKIYSSHFFEHLTYNEGQTFLKECLRVLKPDGIFSICVPNARIYLDAYVKNQMLPENNYFGYTPAYNNTNSKIDYVNYIAYMDGHHKYMFDRENLINVLEKAGLREVKLRGFDSGLDKQERDFQSIYAEGKK